MIKKNIKELIHNIFIKHDIVWLIKDWFPENEYELEEHKVFLYLDSLNPSEINQENIYKKMREIIIEWLGENIINDHNIYYDPIIKEMSWEIFIGLQMIKN